MAEWQQSGISKREFCRHKSIRYNTFHYWFKRLGSASSSGFTEIKVVNQVNQQPGCGYEIIFPSGARMIFQGERSTAWLRELVG